MDIVFIGAIVLLLALTWGMASCAARSSSNTARTTNSPSSPCIPIHSRRPGWA